MPPGHSQYELSTSASGARAKMLTKTSEEPCREEVRAGGRPLPGASLDEDPGRGLPTALSFSRQGSSDALVSILVRAPEADAESSY